MKKRYYHNINGRMRMARRLAICCFLLMAIAGHTMAQNDRQYVIKRVVGTNVHYLSHENNTLQDATNFSPNCIWYSPNNYNYYFMDGTTQRYLKAQLATDGAISHAPNPGSQTLSNTTQDYFFYDWDHGLARGNLVLEGGQHWQAVWLSYEDNVWKMSSMENYDPTPNSARFLRETTTVHQVTVSNESGGAGNLTDFSMNYDSHHDLDGTASPYTYTITPAYTHYHIDGLDDAFAHIEAENFYYYNNQYYDAAPGSTTHTGVSPTGYAWSIECEGDTQYLSFAEDDDVFTISGATQTLYYIHENETDSHVRATLTLTVTYGTGDAQMTQTRTATVTVRTRCKNPTVNHHDSVVTYVGVTVSWLPSAERYNVSWGRENAPASEWSSYDVGDVSSFTIRGLDYDTRYNYKISAICDGQVQPNATVFTFKTMKEPGLMITGSIFGGGRMANVTGKTEVNIVNCDSVGTIFGGNDIAGAVEGDAGSTITLGTAATIGNLNIGSVYGGGNGYYAYNGTSFVTADDSYTSESVAVGGHVNEMTPFHQVGEVVWTNTGTTPKTLDFPSITKTAITVSNDYVKVDSIFGGAKNAFLTFDDYTDNGSNIIIDGGTIMAVFGGNNWGGTQKRGQHHIVVNKTTTNLAANIENSDTHGYGRDFGIRYLFGGGNKVYGSTTNVEIKGGQCDTIFAGGNAADVYAANMTVNCIMAANSGTSGTEYIYGNVYSNAIQSYTGGTNGTITPKEDYGWDGYSGIYNVRTLFGGNNMATFDSKLNQKVPTITLTSGSIGTVYGGGNAGDMWGLSNDNGSGGSLVINDEVVKYGTHVKMNSPTILIDNLYGGCQVSNVRYSTWVELVDGHMGTVYGGCNVSGDVGSTRIDMSANPFNGPDVPNEEYQKVFGGTYVVASGGIVYKNLFAGGNGYYHCLNSDGTYSSDLSYTNHNYVGLSSPTHNETHVVVNTGATVKGNVYAGGNLACVGFDNSTAPTDGTYPKFVGLSSVRMSGGLVEGNVFGGGNMANVYGSNEVQVSGGTIRLSLYGGNDRLGTVATPISNRVLPSNYHTASDGQTSLLEPKVYTYVGLTGNPSITNVYGGGNGYYAYFTSFDAAEEYSGPLETVVSCNIGENNQPIQQCTFVDIGVDGGENGAHIGTVFGGGDGVSVIGFIKVFLNVKTNPIGFSNVGTIFGGNNKGNLSLVPDIILLNGQVNTVYGGCNEGAMTATGRTIGGYENTGSYVRLFETYDPDGEGTTYSGVEPNIKIERAVYGGCRMNGVTNNSLVLVEGDNFSTHPLKGLFGGSDISGHVGGWSRVVVTGGKVGNVYGGGNGNYDYDGHNVYEANSVHSDATLVASSDANIIAPTCANSGADILGGQVGTSALLSAGTVSRVFGAGLGAETKTTGNVEVNIGVADAASVDVCPTIYGEIYGGSALGEVNTNPDNTSPNPFTTTVNFLNGTLKKATVNNVDYGGNLFGGGLGRKAGGGLSAVEAKVYGKVFVNISSESQNAANCFIDLREANIFGCNNTNGSPQGDVEVHVWKTAFNFGDYLTGDKYTSQYIAPDGETPLYAINQVFGGGNQADYTPTDKTTLVYVHSCLNTIRRVFSGGNAAAATGVAATIEGGRMDYIFGGGNGEVSAADIGAGGTNLLVSGGIINHLFGGSNHEGNIEGLMRTEVTGSTDGCTENITEFFGGSNEAVLSTTSGVSAVINCGAGTIAEVYGGSNKAEITGNVKLDVKGGTITSVFGGSKGVQNGAAADINGNVTLNLLGGAITDAFGGSNQNGNITGNITVNVVDYGGTCGLDLTNVYGGGNVTPYAPNNGNRPVVNVIHIAQTDGIKGNVFGGAKGNTAIVTADPMVNIGYDATSMSSYVTGLTIPTSPRAYVMGNVFGGGDAAPVSGNTTVNVFKGEIVHKLVGGGNDIADGAGVSGDVVMNINGGKVCTEPAPTGDNVAGVYGGCNTNGTVGGSIIVNITSNPASSADTTVIGTQVALDYAQQNALIPVSIHGGGYGEGTRVNGSITVNYGFDNGDVGVENRYPKLYGDLYGGSALGTVNDAATDSTNVNVLNGSFKYNILGYTQCGGNIYGGGLGEAGTTNVDKGKVNGKVHVNIGAEGPYGKAYLKGCNVFGCNNTNGSPQEEVFVDVYQTAHEPSGIDSVSHLGNEEECFAIRNVYGGGNKAHYAPSGNSTNWDKKTHNSVHYCDNTIENVYGGGNAANTDGTVVTVDGGRFKYIFGGGNGQSTPANILEGGVTMTIYSGHVGWYFNGCNLHGTVGGGDPIEHYGCDGDDCPCTEDTLMVENYYFGANEALTVGGLEHSINCGDKMDFTNVYAGSRLAVVYGDIKLTVRGGNIGNLYGGSEGSNQISADVKKYPANYNDINNFPTDHQSTLREYFANGAHSEDYGQGGNIILCLEGGMIGNVYGGNDYRGSIEGDITIIVDSTQDGTCKLDVDYIYGGNKLAGYAPDSVLVNGHYQPHTTDRVSPKVYLKNGHVNGAIYGGSKGGSPSHQYGNGIVYSNPLVVIGDHPDVDDHDACVGDTLISVSPKTFGEGTVFGGGNEADLIGNAKVVVQGKSIIEGNVFGGGKKGLVDGNTNVIIDPTTPITPPATPIPRHTLKVKIYPGEEGGSLTITDSLGNPVNNGDRIYEGELLTITVMVNAGFTLESLTAEHGTISSTGANTYTYVMADRDDTITATFTGE